MSAPPPLPLPPPGAWTGSGPYPLRPLDVGDVLDGAARIYARRARTLVLAGAVVILPVNLLAVYAQRELVELGASFGEAVAVTQAEQLLREQILPVIPRLIAGSLLSQLLLVLVSATAVVVAREAVGGTDPGPWGALREALRRSPTLVAAWLLAHLLELLPLLLAAAVLLLGALTQSVPVIVVGVLAILAALPLTLVLMAFVALTVPAIVVEGLGPVAGIGRAMALARRRFWRVLGTMLLVGLVAGLVAGAVGTIPSLLAQFFPGAVGLVLAAAGSSVGQLLGLPFVALATTLVHYDVRVRTEGLDLAVAAQRRFAPMPAPPEFGAFPPATEEPGGGLGD